MRVAIIGAGLSGTSLAYVLKENGVEPVIYEATSSIASGASGNDVGLYNPRFTADKCPEQEFYETAFNKALDIFPKLEGIDWNPCGSLQLLNDEKKAVRFPKTVKNWNWGEEKLRIVSAYEASEIAGVEIGMQCLYIAQSGTFSPTKLCNRLANNVEVHLNTPVTDISQIKADAIVLTCGLGCKEINQASHFPLRPVRGQLTYIRQTEKTKKLRCAVGYSGYIAPALNAKHCVGSSFQPWLDHSDIIDQDDEDNLSRLVDAIPSLQDSYEIVGHRAAVRTTCKDHFPIIGQIEEKVYIVTAPGSHGVLCGLMGSEIISNMILNKKQTLSGEAIASLAPSRF